MMQKTILVFLLLLCVQIKADICKKWNPPVVLSPVPQELQESSGAAFSKLHENILYQHNDSGDGPYIYRQSLSTHKVSSITIPNYKNIDIEDMAVAKCPNSSNSCLYIGDLGDNLKKREQVSVIIAEEPTTLNDKTLNVIQVLKLKYPNGPLDSEGLAVHPNGDVYILTKELNLKKGTAQPAQLFRLSLDKILSADTHTLEPYGRLNLPVLQKDVSVLGQIVTSFDIAPSGKKFLVLTYERAIEVDHDLSLGSLKNTKSWKEQQNYIGVSIKIQGQQEAIAYKSENEFMYTSEAASPFSRAELIKVSCAAP